MAADYVLKQTERLPVLQATLTDADGTVPTTELQAGTLTFLMRKKYGTTPLINAAATVDDATTGAVSYAWDSDDTLANGDYEAEFKLVVGGKAYYFPSSGYIQITVVDNIG